MTPELHEDRRLEALRQHATLAEYRFTSTAPVVGGLVARLREAWNSVATKWQVRPLMEQQSEFNRMLAERLARPPGMVEFDGRLVELDRDQVLAARASGQLATRAGRLRGDLQMSGIAHGRNPRIAFFSPMPPARSGIADYSAGLLPHLARLADITVFVDDETGVKSSGLPVMRASDFPGVRHAFDLPVYQMGNSDHHEIMYDLLLRYPGVVVLHDYSIHHFIYHHTAVHGDWMAYARELNYSFAGNGRAMARAIHSAQIPVPLFDYPMNRRLIDVSLGLIVHSRYAAERVRQIRPDTPLAVIPHYVELQPGRSHRHQLGIADDATLFATYGYITPEKQLEVALSAFRRLLAARPNSHYLVVGDVHPAVDLAGMVRRLGLEERVDHVGYAEDLGTFEDWIRTADVVVNLRQPTVGETSGVALRAMAAARPLIVYDHGWYAEIPAEAALRVAPGDESSLLEALETLGASASLRRSMGQSALNYVRENCAPAQVAAAYMGFVSDVLAWSQK